ncbi:hypothetical protein [Ureibacillus sp. GCM10028918]|uniref:hypothetical protein n=1 Tax=Ureibacillus sp. GCM10028918 TaxID=3273429 RepID=UPI00361AA667
MNEIVQIKLKEFVKIFNDMPNCKIEANRGGRLLIASHKPVPWAKSLKKQYGESDYKIGYIDPKKNALGFYIDFPIDLLNFGSVTKIINPEEKLVYSSIKERAPSGKSWWRLRKSENFDSIHLVLRNEDLLSYNVQEESWMKLIQYIVDVHK